MTKIKVNEFKIEDQISLRLRFKIQSLKSLDEIIKSTNILQLEKPKSCTVKIVDQHIWIGIIKKKQKLYSPNLHLELERKEDEGTTINAKFGPDPSLWTLFMFLHFGLAIVFITFLILGYANYALNKAYKFDFMMLILVAVIWVGLYLFARINRNKGKAQAEYLLSVVNQHLI